MANPLVCQALHFFTEDMVANEGGMASKPWKNDADGKHLWAYGLSLMAKTALSMNRISKLGRLCEYRLMMDNKEV